MLSFTFDLFDLLLALLIGVLVGVFLGMMLERIDAYHMWYDRPTRPTRLPRPKGRAPDHRIITDTRTRRPQ